MAGEWGVFAKYLSERPAADADRIYSQVLQSLNRGNSGLLPEEVLAFAEACPTDEPKPWQVTAWAAMLKQAAAKNSAGPMLAQVRAGTRLFGGSDPAKRRRTVEMLSGGGLLAEAYEFLPPLEEARAPETANWCWCTPSTRRTLHRRRGTVRRAMNCSAAPGGCSARFR